MIPSGIEPATFRLLAQCLKQQVLTIFYKLLVIPVATPDPATELPIGKVVISQGRFDGRI
jgi:hypothetical protein